jgi:hypothetical protein
VFSDGAGSHRHLTSGALLRSSKAAGRALRDHLDVMTPQPAEAGVTP